MVAKRDDTAAGGFRFEPWTPVDDIYVRNSAGFKDSRDELTWLINNAACARPEEEREALLAAGNRLCDLDDQTVADLLKVISTAMVAAQPKHSKADHQKRRYDHKTFYATLRKNEIYDAADNAKIEPGQPHAPKKVERAMVDRAKDPNRDYDIDVPSRRTIARALMELSRYRKSKSSS
jgi:hypothetical protein